MTDETYSVLYAQGVPHYANALVAATSDHAAVIAAIARPVDELDFADPDWSSPVCRRIVHIEAPDGRIIAEDVSLDYYRLITVDDAVTALAIWEYVSAASLHRAKHPALAAHRAAVGTYALREACLALAPYCNRVWHLLPDDLRDAEPWDWEIIPAIIDAIDWPNDPPPEQDMAAALVAAFAPGEAA